MSVQSSSLDFLQNKVGTTQLAKLAVPGPISMEQHMFVQKRTVHAHKLNIGIYPTIFNK